MTLTNNNLYKNYCKKKYLNYMLYEKHIQKNLIF